MVKVSYSKRHKEQSKQINPTRIAQTTYILMSTEQLMEWILWKDFPALCLHHSSHKLTAEHFLIIYTWHPSKRVEFCFRSISALTCIFVLMILGPVSLPFSGTLLSQVVWVVWGKHSSQTFCSNDCAGKTDLSSVSRKANCNYWTHTYSTQTKLYSCSRQSIRNHLTYLAMQKVRTHFIYILLNV
jgi:hypothetical protein